MAWTTPGTATAGDVLTASFWNTQVRDNQNFLYTPPMVKVYRSSDLTSYTNGANITWNAEEFDTDTMFTSGTDVTIKTAGIWMVTGFAYITATATLTATFFGVKKNASYVAQQYHPPYSSTSSLVGYSGIHKFAVNDVITANVELSGGSAYNVNGAASEANDQTRLTLVWLGKDS